MSEYPGMTPDKVADIMGKRWKTTDGEITGPQVLAAYRLIRDHGKDRGPRLVAMSRACGFTIGSGRKWDRCASILKRNNLIRYVRGTGWVAVVSHGGDA